LRGSAETTRTYRFVLPRPHACPLVADLDGLHGGVLEQGRLAENAMTGGAIMARFVDEAPVLAGDVEGMRGAADERHGQPLSRIRRRQSANGRER